MNLNYVELSQVHDKSGPYTVFRTNFGEATPYDYVSGKSLGQANRTIYNSQGANWTRIYDLSTSTTTFIQPITERIRVDLTLCDWEPGWGISSGCIGLINLLTDSYTIPLSIYRDGYTTDGFIFSINGYRPRFLPMPTTIVPFMLSFIIEPITGKLEIYINNVYLGSQTLPDTKHTEVTGVHFNPATMYTNQVAKLGEVHIYTLE